MADHLPNDLLNCVARLDRADHYLFRESGAGGLAPRPADYDLRGRARAACDRPGRCGMYEGVVGPQQQALLGVSGGEPAKTALADLLRTIYRVGAGKHGSWRTALSSGAKFVAARVLPPRYYLALAVRSNLRRGEAELHLLPQLLEPARAFVDVGANIGVYAAVAERLIERVYAFEPHPVLAQRLRRSLRPTSRVSQLALSDHASDAVLWAPPEELTRCSLDHRANGDAPVVPIDVSTARLDDLNLPNVGLIKIDVEGHELAVIRGAQETIARDRPAIIVEIEKRHHGKDWLGVFDHFAELGYQGFFVHRARLRPLADYDFANFQRDENLPNGARHPDFINNFIYVHQSDQVKVDWFSRNQVLQS